MSKDIKWFKHLSKSIDNPDIIRLITRFGHTGYYVFFGLLEIMTQKFDTDNPGFFLFTPDFLAQRLKIRWRKLREVLLEINKTRRIEIKIDHDGVHLNCSRFKELMDNYIEHQLVETKYGGKKKIEKPPLNNPHNTATGEDRIYLELAQMYCEDITDTYNLGTVRNHIRDAIKNGLPIKILQLKIMDKAFMPRTPPWAFLQAVVKWWSSNRYQISQEERQREIKASQCPACKGRGIDIDQPELRGGYKKCSECKGKGKIK